jgi:hypothetical protein
MKSKSDNISYFIDNLQPNPVRTQQLIEELKVERRRPKLTLIKGGKS